MRRILRRSLGVLSEAALLAGLATVGVLVGQTAGIDPLSLGDVYAGSSYVAGTVFRDIDADGERDTSEQPIAGHRINLVATDGTLLRSTSTDIDGIYRFSDIADGEYVVRYGTADWHSLRDDWTPTTTGTMWPEARATVLSGSTIDFGWRPIVKSLDAAAPISRHVGDTGLTVEAFNDVVPARAVYDAVSQGYVGVEGAAVVIRLGYSSTSTTSTSVSIVSGRYTSYRAVSYVTFGSWLDGDWTLSHEYGHAWSLYYAYMVQQDPTLAGYLSARHLAGDPRLNLSYAWQPRELLADDYRQLFGSPTARTVAPLNREVPAADAVPGLREYLAGAFMGMTPSAPADEPVPSVTATPSMTATPFASPTPSPAATTSPPPTLEVPATAIELSALSVTPTPVRTAAVISLDVSGESTVSVAISDRRGRIVRTLPTVAATAATHLEVPWDRTDDAGRRVKAGTYTVRAIARSASGTDEESTSVKLS